MENICRLWYIWIFLCWGTFSQGLSEFYLKLSCICSSLRRSIVWFPHPNHCTFWTWACPNIVKRWGFFFSPFVFWREALKTVKFLPLSRFARTDRSCHLRRSFYYRKNWDLWINCFSSYQKVCWSKYLTASSVIFI